MPYLLQVPDSLHYLRHLNCETIGRLAVVRALVHSLFDLLEAIVTEDRSLARQMAVESAGIISDFAFDRRKLEGPNYLHTVVGIWQMAVFGLSIVEEFMSPENWRSAKVMFCVEVRNNAFTTLARERAFAHELINLSGNIFIAGVEPFPCDPERMLEAGTGPVPEWFANRVCAEFKSINLNSPKYASNDAFYRAAWDSVQPMVVSKQQKKKDKTWTSAKKKIQRALEEVAKEERERIAKSVQAFVQLRADYREHGVVRPQNMFEGHAVKVMIGMRAGCANEDIEAMKQTAQNISSPGARTCSTAPVAQEATLSRKAQRREKLRLFLQEIVEDVVASVPSAAEHAQWVEGVALQVSFQRGGCLTREEILRLLGQQVASLQRREASLDRAQAMLDREKERAEQTLAMLDREKERAEQTLAMLDREKDRTEQTQARLDREKERAEQTQARLDREKERAEQTQARLEQAMEKAAECSVWQREAESRSRALYSAQQSFAAAGAWLSQEVHSCQLEIGAVATGLEQQAMHADDDSKACCICLDAAADHALVPCGHVCVCAACVSMAGNQCPLCRQRCDGAQAVFWA